MMRDKINNEYFNWLYELVCKRRYTSQISYKKLLMCLHNVEFRYSIDRDENRAYDGMDLRVRFGYETGYNTDCLDDPCSVLEMIVALAIRCEECIMDDTKYGDRMTQWFWGMLTNLGIGFMSDDRFDKIFVMDAVNRLLDRDYEPDGRGGLFTIKHCDQDLRDVEIWFQLLWYLDSIV